MTSSTNEFIVETTVPDTTEFSKEVTVYRFVATRRYDLELLNEGIELSQLTKDEFGIVEQWREEQGYIRTLWVKLGSVDI